jgi:hypothetical protein
MGIWTKEDAAKHDMDALMLLATLIFASMEMEINTASPEREHVGRLVEFTLEVMLWTAANSHSREASL